METTKFATFNHEQQYVSKILPQPSKEFLEVYVKTYNEGRPITEVMVEYINCNYCYGEGYMFADGKRPCPHCNDTNGKLKVKSDNTINIELIKDSWNRKEVDSLLRHLYYDVTGKLTGHPDGFCDKWIKENL